MKWLKKWVDGYPDAYRENGWNETICAIEKMLMQIIALTLAGVELAMVHTRTTKHFAFFVLGYTVCNAIYTVVLPHIHKWLMKKNPYDTHSNSNKGDYFGNY